MRFRYIDSKGREIALDSVEALAARIELGAVAAETELYDATTEKWGPAESHDVVQKLLAEAAARSRGGPPGPPVAMARSDAPGVWPPPVADKDEATSVDSLTVAHDLDESVAAALAASAPPVEGTKVPSPTDGPTDPPEHDLEIGSGLEVEGLETNAVNEAALDREPPMDGFRATVMDPWELESAQEPTDDGPPPSEAAAGGVKLEIDDEWGRSSADRGEAHPFDGPAPLDEPPAGSGGWPAEAMLEDQRFARRSYSSPMVEVLSAPAIQWAFLVASVLVMGLFGSVGGQALVWRILFTLGGVSAVGLVTGLLLWRDPERRTLIPAATFGLIAVISVPLFLVGSRAEAAGPAPVPPIGRADASIPAPDPLARANPGELAMEGRALEGVIEGLDSLAVAYDIGSRPPQWLQGIYLAHASQYPEVEDYWHRYADYVAEVQTRDIEWFEASYHARLREAGIRADVIDDLVERGLDRFRATQSRRDKLYRQMAALAESSLELHALLVAREDDIEYQPFRQKGVSKAPVVEALVKDPQLEDRMWAIIGRVALSLESISELGETSPARLQQAMMDSIRVSLE